MKVVHGRLLINDRPCFVILISDRVSFIPAVLTIIGEQGKKIFSLPCSPASLLPSPLSVGIQTNLISVATPTESGSRDCSEGIPTRTLGSIPNLQMYIPIIRTRGGGDSETRGEPFPLSPHLLVPLSSNEDISAKVGCSPDTQTILAV